MAQEDGNGLSSVAQTESAVIEKNARTGTTGGEWVSHISSLPDFQTNKILFRPPPLTMSMLNAHK